MTRIVQSMVVIACVTVAACGGSTNTTTAPSSTSSPTKGAPAAALPSAATSADLAFCVSETNRYRMQVGRAALARSTAIEAVAAQAAMSDGTTHTAHGYTKQHGVYAENELPWWPLGTYGTVQATVLAGVQMMWSEGPTGGHYQNITDARFTQMGCGVYIASGEITVVQDFQ